RPLPCRAGASRIQRAHRAASPRQAPSGRAPERPPAAPRRAGWLAAAPSWLRARPSPFPETRLERDHGEHSRRRAAPLVLLARPRARPRLFLVLDGDDAVTD